MARSYKRDKNGRFASTGSGGASNSVRKTGSRLADDDSQSDKRWAKRETRKLNEKQAAAGKELKRLQAKQPTAKVQALQTKLGELGQRKKALGEQAAASRARLAELKKQLEASKARMGGKSATKRGARR